MANFGFDPTEYKDPQNNFTPVPPGRYHIKGIKNEEKDTTNGMMIKSQFEITRGEFAKRKIFENFNVINKNETAQNIAREAVSNWARACGKPKAMDTDLLEQIEVQADIYVQPAQGQYGASNRIRFFYHKDYVDPAPGTEPATKTAAASEPAKGEAIAGDTAKQNPAPAKKEAPAGGKSKNPWDD